MHALNLYVSCKKAGLYYYYTAETRLHDILAELGPLPHVKMGD